MKSIRLMKLETELESIKEDLNGVMVLCETETNTELLDQLDKLLEEYSDQVTRVMRCKIAKS